MHMANNRTLNYMRQKLIELQGETDASTITLGDSNTPLSEMDRSSRQNISKDIAELNNTVNWIIDIYRQLPTRTAEYTFFSCSHGTFTNIDHIVDHKT